MIVNKELRELQKKLKEAMKLLLQEKTLQKVYVLAVEIGKIQAQIDRADENGEWGISHLIERGKMIKKYIIKVAETLLDAVSLFSIFAIGYVVLIICHDGGCTW